MSSWSILFLIGLSAQAFMTVWDVYLTNKGIKAGVAVEGNWLIDKIFGTVKPNLFQSIVGAAICDSWSITIALLGMRMHNLNEKTAVFYFGFFLMVLYAYRRIKSVKAWRKLLTHN